jgi:hypothetical protein
LFEDKPLEKKFGVFEPPQHNDKKHRKSHWKNTKWERETDQISQRNRERVRERASCGFSLFAEKKKKQKQQQHDSDAKVRNPRKSCGCSNSERPLE